VHEDLNTLTETIIGAALEVHHELGPGLLGSAYDECFAVELTARGLTIERQKALPVIYKNQRVDCGYRLDFVVELLSYLRFARCPVGLLFNFHAGYLTRDGLKRVMNGFPG